MPSTCTTATACEALLHEWMLSIKEVVAEGKVKHVGLSEVSPKWLRHAHAVHPVACIQQEWSLLSRGIEEDFVHTCKERGLSAAQLSLVWLHNRAEIMRVEMVAIPRTTQLEHAEANACALGFQRPSMQRCWSWLISWLGHGPRRLGL
mmetsp:Transcript_54179/g.126094  ORF Transcript_54179/g.126094 Transcript_54179/m.126094 type:complete len:148 (+) Transcript_54179:285-728(+)